jgi:hypothetical protein
MSTFEEKFKKSLYLHGLCFWMIPLDSHKCISLKMSEKGKTACSKELKGNADSKHVQHLTFILNVPGSANTAEVSLFLQANAKTKLKAMYSSLN